MTDREDETITEEDALDGLLDAVDYCDRMGWNDTAKEIADLYQRVGKLGIERELDEE